MDNLSEIAAGGRVTRSLRKRLTSIDSDLSSRPGTPLPAKLATLDEMTDSPSRGLRRTRRSSVATPNKTSPTSHGTPEVFTPARRSTRRHSLSMNAEDEQERNIVKQPVFDALLEEETDGVALKSKVVNDSVRAPQKTPKLPKRTDSSKTKTYQTVHGDNSDSDMAIINVESDEDSYGVEKKVKNKRGRKSKTPAINLITDKKEPILIDLDSEIENVTCKRVTRSLSKSPQIEDGKNIKRSTKKDKPCPKSKKKSFTLNDDSGDELEFTALNDSQNILTKTEANVQTFEKNPTPTIEIDDHSNVIEKTIANQKEKCVSVEQSESKLSNNSYTKSKNSSFLLDENLEEKLEVTLDDMQNMVVQVKAKNSDSLDSNENIKDQTLDEIPTTFGKLKNDSNVIENVTQNQLEQNESKLVGELQSEVEKFEGRPKHRALVEIIEVVKLDNVTPHRLDRISNIKPSPKSPASQSTKNVAFEATTDDNAIKHSYPKTPLLTKSKSQIDMDSSKETLVFEKSYQSDKASTASFQDTSCFVEHEASEIPETQEVAKTPLLTKIKRNIDMDSSKEALNLEMSYQSDKASTASFQDVSCFVELETCEIPETQEVTKEAPSPSSPEYHDATNDGNNEPYVEKLIENTPKKSKMLLANLQTSTPITELTMEKKNSDVKENKKEQVSNNDSVDHPIDEPAAQVDGKSNENSPQHVSTIAIPEENVQENSIRLAENDKNDNDSKIAIKQETTKESTTTNLNQSNNLKSPYAKSWSQGMLGTSRDNNKIDVIANESVKHQNVETHIEADNNSMNHSIHARYESNDDEVEQEQEEEELSENEQVYETNDFVENEAMEVDENYQSGDSMDEEERRDMEENEIDDEGESLGSNDTEDDEYYNESEQNEVEENESFIATSESEHEMLLEYSDDDEHLHEQPQKKNKHKRIVLMDSENSEEEKEEEQQVNNLKNTSHEQNTNFSWCEALEITTLVNESDNKDAGIESIKKNDKPHEQEGDRANDSVSKIKSAKKEKRMSLEGRKSFENTESFKSDLHLRLFGESPINDSVSKIKSANKEKRKSLEGRKSFENTESYKSDLHLRLFNVSPIKLKVKSVFDTTDDEQPAKEPSTKSEQLSKSFNRSEYENSDENDETIKLVIKDQSENKSKVKKSRKSLNASKSLPNCHRNEAEVSGDITDEQVESKESLNDSTKNVGTADENEKSAHVEDVDDIEEELENSQITRLNKSKRRSSRISLIDSQKGNESSDKIAENQEIKNTTKPNYDLKKNKNRTSLNRSSVADQSSREYEYALSVTEDDVKDDGSENELAAKEQNKTLLNSSGSKLRKSKSVGAEHIIDENSNNESEAEETETLKQKANKSTHSANISNVVESSNEPSNASTNNDEMAVDTNEPNNASSLNCSNVIKQFSHEYEDTDSDAEANNSDDSNEIEQLAYEHEVKLTKGVRSFSLKHFLEPGEESKNSSHIERRSYTMDDKFERHEQSSELEAERNSDSEQNQKKLNQSVDEEFVNDKNISSEDEQQLSKLTQISAAKNTDLLRKRRQSLIMPIVDTENKNKKSTRKSHGSSRGENIQLSKSFIDDLAEKRNTANEKEIKRFKRRLSKSFCEDIALEANKSTAVAQPTAKKPKHSQEYDDDDDVKSSEPQLVTSGGEHLQNVLKRCDEILKAANKAKLELKINYKKSKVRLTKKAKQQQYDFQAIDENENGNKKVSSIASTDDAEKAEQVKKALTKALKASVEILTNGPGKKKNKLLKVNEEQYQAKRLPNQLLEEISEAETVTTKTPKELQHAYKKEAKSRKHKLKTTAGFVVEAPMTPLKKKTPVTKYQHTTGIIIEEPITPPPKNRQKLYDFHESPNTPQHSIGFKVRKILECGQDAPPTPTSSYNKQGKRKRRHIQEPKYTLPKPQWSQSGEFLEELVFKSHSGATEFLVSNLNGANTGAGTVGKAVKKLKSKHATTTAPFSTAYANALNFKSNALNCGNIPRETSREVLQRKQRAVTHQHF